MINAIPKEKVFLKKLNREVVLDFFTLNDDQWMIDKFGEENIQRALEKFDADILLSIFWHQLENDSKKILSKVKIIEWEGMKEVELVIDEPVELLKRVVSGSEELMMIWMAIIETKRKSIPEYKDNVKKKVTEAKA